MKTRVRSRLRSYKKGSVIGKVWLVETYHGGMWLPFGNDDGVLKFQTKALAEKQEAKLKKALKP